MDNEQVFGRVTTALPYLNQQMKRKLLYILATICILFCVLILKAFPPNPRTPLKEGDIIFQTSQSRQSKFIVWATHSLKTHCGVIIEKGGKQYVLEASNVVKLTPLKEFVNRGLYKKYQVYRLTDKPVKISYRQYLGRTYDSQFSWTDRLYYCSELVWKIYKNQLGVELCKPRPLSDYTTLGLGKELKRRGISKESLFVAPSDIAGSYRLYKLGYF